MLTDPDTPIVSRLCGPLRRFGIAGLIFFTVKGLLWLAIPALLSQAL